MADKKLKSIAEIAKIAGVSKSTVSRALNDSPFANAETKSRIREIMEEYDFRPSAAARNLSLKSSHTIAFISHAYKKKSCTISDPFSLEIMGGIAAGLHEVGYDMLTVIMDPDDSDWVDHYLDSGRVDGFILMTSVKKGSHIDMLVKKEAPFVAWGRIGQGKFCTVCGDDVKGGKLATQRLISRGCSKIGFIGGYREESEVQDRYKGYEDALKEAGRAVDPDLVLYADYKEELAAKAIETLLERDPGMDGVFSNNDVMAIAAMKAIRASGRRIPEDVAVVGYDDISLAANVTPALTTISQNIPMAGKLLARDLVSYLKEGTITTTVVPVELIARESA